jgi:hypothetical protein
MGVSVLVIVNDLCEVQPEGTHLDTRMHQVLS